MAETEEKFQRLKFGRKTVIGISLFVVGLIFWFVGDYLQSIYGFEPPHYYMFAGLFLQLAGFLCILVIGFALLLAVLFRAKKAKDK